MTEDLIKKTKLLGNYKTIIGDGSTDIVLETLGKVYIKTGNNLKLINELFKILENINKLDSLKIANNVIITDNLENLKYPGDGKLIFDVVNKALYIAYDERYILILDNIKIDEEPPKFLETPEEPKYVLKTGDTMTGVLTIKTKGAPLIVASKELVKNFNALFIEGYSSKELAIKKLDEYITGLWTFNNDIVFNNTIGSSDYVDGYNGYGWRLDSNTNMLTIDYLIVRKAMHVFELVINRISATNGSIWVTDTCKIKNVSDIHLLDINNLSNITLNTWYIPYNGTEQSFNVDKKVIMGEHLAEANGNFLGDQTFYNFGYIFRVNKLIDLTTVDFRNPDIWSEDIKNNVSYIPFFQDSMTLNIGNNFITNKIYDILLTPSFFSTKKQLKFKDKTEILTIYIYYKYFGNKSLSTTNIKIIDLDDSTYPTIKEGDLVRCQKFQDNNIKYYDALVSSRVDTYSFIIIKSPSVFDNYTNLENEDCINSELYGKTNYSDNSNANEEESKKIIEQDPQLILATFAKDDELVRIGNIIDINRLGSTYITSSEFNSPNIKVLDKVIRPDYSVVYTTPKFSKLTYNNKEYFYKKVPKKEDGDICIDNIFYKLFDKATLECDIDLFEGQYKAVSDNPVKALLGKIDGIRDSTLEKLPHGYGLYSNNVFLTGEFYLNNGKSIMDISGDYLEFRYKTAGFKIEETISETGEKIPVLNEKGEQTYDKYGLPIFETNISMNADKFYFKINNKTVMSLGNIFNNDGIIKGTLLDVSGAIKSRGLYIDDDKGNLNCYITELGNLYAKNAYLSGNVFADIGYLGGKVQKLYKSDIEYNKYSYPDCKTLIKVNNKMLLINVYKYPNNPKDFTLNNGVSFGDNDYINIYIGGFVIDLYSLESIPGSYSGYNRAFMALYSGGDPWINIVSMDDSGRYNVVSRMGLNTMSATTGISANFYAYNHKDERPYGMVIDVSANSDFFDSVGLQVSAKSHMRSDGMGTAINAIGYVKTNSYFLGKFGVLNNDGSFYKGLFPDKPQELPDLDDIRLTVYNGLIVGYRYE